jgi:hypothetical protein
MCKRCAARRDPRCLPALRASSSKTALIAVRAHDDEPDICVNCYRLPAAFCHQYGRLRPCTLATSDRQIVGAALRGRQLCAPAAARLHTGSPLGRSPYVIRVIPPRYCEHQRRLVAPPTTAPDCAGMPVSLACGDCGLEDKL